MLFVYFSLNYDVKYIEIISRLTVPIAVNILQFSTSFRGWKLCSETVGYTAYR